MIWLSIAWRNFGRNFKRNSFTFSILVVGVTAAVLTIGYIKATFFLIKEGTIKGGGVGHFQIAYSDEFEGYSDFPLQHGISPPVQGKVVKFLKNIEPVKQVLPRLSFQGIISNGERSLVFIGQGVDPVAERRLSESFANMVQGTGLEYGSKDDDYRIVIGVELAELLGLKPGEFATIMGITTFGGLNAIDVSISGVIETGSSEANKLFLRAPIGLAQELLITDKISRMVVQIEDNINLQSTIDDLDFKKIDNSKVLALKDWEELSPFYGQLFDLYFRQFSILGLILCLVITLSISNSIALSIFERRKAIATLMSIGIPLRLVRRSFLYQGGMLGALAGGVGVILSFIFVHIINSANISMPPPPGGNTSYPLLLIFDSGYALLVLIFISMLAICVSWFSAHRITKINIIESLNYE